MDLVFQIENILAEIIQNMFAANTQRVRVTGRVWI